MLETVVLLNIYLFIYEWMNEPVLPFQDSLINKKF